MKVSESVVYMTDNGATYCGAHLGMTAKMTGRDISGQAIMAVTPEVLHEADAMGYEIKCETCGKAPSRLVTVEG